MLEKDIEKRVVKDLEDRGCFVIKLKDLSRRGAPDRLAITQNGVPIFFELKTEKGKIAPHQLRYCDNLINHNTPVFVIDSTFGWTRWLDEYESYLAKE